MEQTVESTENGRFTLGFYFQTLTRMLSSPGEFFRGLGTDSGFGRPVGFLIVSSLFFTGASLTCLKEGHALMAGILFLNAMAMPFISAAVGFVVMTMIVRERQPFSRFFSLYAYSAGVTMLASWIPLFVWITEPWKWLLIGMGMVKGCGLRWFHAVIIIGLSLFILVLFFCSVAPVIAHLRGF